MFAAPDREISAVALSGGGAKGDFQVGALRYLYDFVLTAPEIITGTSVGAVNGAKMAEAGNGVIAQKVLSELEDLWLGMRTSDDLYSEESWFSDLSAQAKALFRWESIAGFGPAALLDVPLAAGLLLSAVGGAAIVGYLEVTAGLQNSSVLNLDPIDRRLRGGFGGWERLGAADDRGRSVQLVVDDAHVVHALLVGTANDFWTCRQEAPGAQDWTPWVRLGGAGDRGITLSATLDGGGVVHAFAVGTANDFWTCRQEAPGAQDWTPWVRLGARSVRGTSVEAVSNASGTLEAFARASDGRVLHCFQRDIGTRWSPWRRIGGARDRLLVHDVMSSPNGIVVVGIGIAYDVWRAGYVPPDLDPAKVLDSGTELRLAAVQLEDGQTEIFDQHGTLLKNGSTTVPLPSAVLASASIPAAFPPVSINDRNYVDGGVREITPVQAAADAGATTIYAINCSGPPVRQESVVDGGIIEIAKRSLGLVLDEVSRDDLRITTYVPAEKYFFIAPEHEDVHDVLMIDPGLVRISMSYGWMRAADVVARLAQDDLLGSAWSITEARREAWRLEHFAHGRDTDPSAEEKVGEAEAIRAARDQKRRVRKFFGVREANGLPVPAGANAWWDSWEAHPWAPSSESPWDEIVTSDGEVVPSEPPPV